LFTDFRHIFRLDKARQKYYEEWSLASEKPDRGAEGISCACAMVRVKQKYD